jgi:opacity protein-like surface antigen
LIVKKLMLLALLLAGLAPAAHAQVFGQYTPAEILAVNSRLGGAYVNFSDDVVGALGQLRLSFYPNIDFGFQGGLSRLDLGSTTKTSLRLGGDLRFGVMKAAAGRPVDVAVGAALGVETGDDYSVLRLGPSVVASHAFTLSGGSGVVPYAGAMLCFSSVDVGEQSDTDFSVPVRLGAELRAIPGLHLTGEIQLRLGDDFDDHTAFSVGVNLPF